MPTSKGANIGEGIASQPMVHVSVNNADLFVTITELEM